MELNNHLESKDNSPLYNLISWFHFVEWRKKRKRPTIKMKKLLKELAETSGK
jgi:hypothetical protein